MRYAEAIRGYISNIPLDQILATREVLHLGTRAAVDLTMSRLVKAKALIRLAPGIFVRAGSIIPPAIAIVQAKAAAFGRAIASHGSVLAQHFGFIDEKESHPLFCIGGGSSSFRSVHGQTNFIGTCDRKRHLGESLEGTAIRAFWHLGRDTFESFAQDLIGRLTANEQARVARQAAWMPAWMSDKFIQG
jgi:hypothetical protein